MTFLLKRIFGLKKYRKNVDFWLSLDVPTGCERPRISIPGSGSAESKQPLAFSAESTWI
ncbi:hypothetical protein [Bartonella sp. CL100XZDX]|uniref:hypothetical protein n=1 Tax=Bartonella sp. CL100XZDX TaxID=3243515 RepID=UPI0035CF45C4